MPRPPHKGLADGRRISTVASTIERSTPKTRLLGLGTAVPGPAVPQPIIASFLSRVARAQPEAPARLPRYIDVLASRSGIETRHSVLSDYVATDPEAFEFYPKNWALDPFPTTAQRMTVYREASVDLARSAGARALEDARVRPEDITHLVLTTCTGFFAPGPDVALQQSLGLSPDVQRMQIGFMGCYAGLNGLRAADQIVRSDPEAKVLQVSVELCTLHYQRTPTVEVMVPNILFADGAGAAVYAADGGGSEGLATVTATRSTIAPDTQGQMAWEVGDHGFVMTLDDAVPGTLEAQVGPFVDALARAGDTSRAETAGWAVHPGGRRIVEAVASGLNLDDDGVAPAFDVLRTVGNLSSATIFFVLDRALRRTEAGPVMALGFGPGLTMEGAALMR